MRTDGRVRLLRQGVQLANPLDNSCPSREELSSRSTWSHASKKSFVVFLLTARTVNRLRWVGWIF